MSDTEQAKGTAEGGAEQGTSQAAKEKASQAVAQAQEKASEVAGQAQEKMQGVAEQTKGQLREKVQQRSTQAGEQVSSTVQDARAISAELRAKGKDAPARLVDQAADRAERLGGYLRQSDADRILRDVEDAARRRPWAVVAGGVALGFAASRFLKASSSERYRSRSAAGSAGQGTSWSNGGGMSPPAQLQSGSGGV